jgi:hypothetical protein
MRLVLRLTKETRKYLDGLVAPVLLAVYPVVFMYQVNAETLDLRSLLLPLLACASVATGVFIVALLLCNGTALSASNATIAFLVGFFVYGSIVDFLLRVDRVSADHWRVLPVVMMIASYAGYLAARLGGSTARAVQLGTRFVLGGLVLLNGLMALGTETRKYFASHGSETLRADRLPTALLATDREILHPDVYYIVLDEYSSFDVAREYWGYREIADFETFLLRRGFFVATDSRSRTDSTLVEMARRLNFQEFEEDLAPLEYTGAIAHNRAMRAFKALGYTTVVFDGLAGPFGFPGKTPVVADFSYQYPPGAAERQIASFDPFAEMVLGRTMLRAVSDPYRQQVNPSVRYLGNNILYTFDQVAALEGVPSPRFVYAHINLPHAPFIFDKDGGLNDTAALWNWKYYLGSYIFATRKTQELVDRLFAGASQGNPPIIILQSDHGARNHEFDRPGAATLSDYPDEYRYHILNALFLPGVDYSTLDDDLNPMNTFPLILNLYFGMALPEQ